MTATPSEPLTLTTADGVELEGEAVVPAELRAAAVLTHPHPLYGGTMHSPVTDALFRALPAAGVAVVRFNFRSVGRSSGTHGGGIDEQRDVEAALDHLVTCAPDVPLYVAGWSFGADVALQVVDERLAGWFLAAPPLAVVPVERMLAAQDPRPKRLAVPAHDQFCPPDSARQATAGWANTEVEVVTGADHFFAGRADALTARARHFLLA
jgi:alpha/beta superfamily hydrolase